MRDEQLQRPGQGRLAVAALGDVQRHVMRVRAGEVFMRVGVGDHVQLDLARRRTGFGQQPAERAQIAIGGAGVHHLLVGQQHRALGDGHALGAEQGFPGAQDMGVGHPVQRGADDQLRQHLQKDGRDAGHAGAVQRGPGGLQRGLRRHPVPEGQEDLPVLDCIGVGQASRVGHAQRVGQQCGVQGAFGGAGLRGRHQLRPGQECAPQIGRGDQPRAVAVAKLVAGRDPEIAGKQGLAHRSAARSGHSGASSSVWTMAKTGAVSRRCRVRKRSRISPASNRRSSASTVPGA